MAFKSFLGSWRLSQDTTKETAVNELHVWYAGFLVTLGLSMGILIKATQALPIGTAYAVWTGMELLGRF